MKILLTGGSGDLGTLLASQLQQRGDIAHRLDIRAPQDQNGVFIEGSILDRPLLEQSMQHIDCVVHIAAWHGIHEVRGEKDADDFWNLNVNGTYYVFEAAHRAGVQNVIFISSTSIDEPYNLYGHTKVLGEQIAETYFHRHGMNVLTLRPRAFIPHWNTAAYQNFVAWAHWFWGGAVHIDDVAQGVLRGIDLLATHPLGEYLALVLDGAYEYSVDELANWQGAETFKRHYAAFYDLALQHGLDPARPPNRLDIQATQHWLGYQPRYSLRNLLEELATYGAEGPPPPAF